MFDSLLRSPFSFLSEPISRTMSSGALSIEGITRVESQGRECLKINYRVDSSRLEWEGTAKAASKAGWGRGWIVVSPDDGWVIHEFVTFPENSPERRAVKRITYGVKEHGITVPTRVENLAAHRLSVLEIETLRHGQTPANEFTLAHYGLPNLDEPSTKTYQSRLGYWFVALGLLALGLVGALKWPRKTAPRYRRCTAPLNSRPGLPTPETRRQAPDTPQNGPEPVWPCHSRPGIAAAVGP